MPLKEVYSTNIKEIFSELKTSEKGLSSADAKRRIVKYGPNELQEVNKNSWLKIFVSQFMNPLVLILIAAVLVSFAVGRFIDSIVILVILFINAVLGFVQEFKAEKAIELLRKLSSPKSVVFRNGVEKVISSKEIVPGDILLVYAGNKIPADGRIFESIGLEMDESSLTGESTPVKKSINTIKQDAVLAERSNMVFSGTIASVGKAKVVVTATGPYSELGKIASMVQGIVDTKTPLQERLAKFSRWIGIGTIVVAGLIFLAGVLVKNLDFMELFMASVSLAVAAIPEGLPAVMTICLALGIRRMLHKKALIRRLKSVETLGSVTVICSDKTGTITKNEMAVTRIYANNDEFVVKESGFEKYGEKVSAKNIGMLLKVALSCNDATELIGDPTEVALVKLAYMAGLKNKEDRVGEMPFSSETKHMVTLHKGGKKYVKGAPEVVLEKCRYIEVNGVSRAITRKDREAILSKNREMARESLRVLGFAYSKRGDRFIFLGLAGMIDPPRENVAEAISLCMKAGIRPIMITGDHRDTAEAIAKKVGIRGKVMVGSELDQVDDERLRALVREYSIFARTTSAHKVRILDALQSNGEIVAMTGDGVNDAPALKKADVGVAMNIRGTDVSREVSDIILLDDNFSAIVSAVKEGRVIYNNIKKFIKFLLAANLGEVLLFVVSIFALLPLPLLPVQILFVNLVTDGLPALALGVEPPERDVMNRKPRNPKEGIFKGMGFFLIAAALLSFVFFVVYYTALRSGFAIEKARTLTFATVICFELFLAFSCRSDNAPIYRLGFFGNRKLILAVISSFAAMLLVIYTPLSRFFGVVPLGAYDWIRVLIFAVSGFVFFESYKIVKSLIRK